MKMGRASRRGVSGIVSTVIMFAILFTVGMSYFIFVNGEESSYQQNLLSATNNLQSSLVESLTVSALLETNGDIGFTATDNSSLTVNMTAALVISSTGALLKCDGVGFPAGSGCANSTPTLWIPVTPGATSASIDTGYVYVTGTTDTVKVVTARGNAFSASYPTPADQSTSSQSVTVSLDSLKWVQLIPQASSLYQSKYVANCNSTNCAATFTTHNVQAGDILVDAIGWATNAPPSTPTDTRSDVFTLGASSSVAVPASASVVQSKYTSNCNAASCGLAFSSNIVSGHTLVYAVGWANQNPPSAPTDTRGDTFTLGASQSVTVNPNSPAVVQHNYMSNCGSSTCSLAFTGSVTASNTLVYGLGWPSTTPYSYVPITITNSQSTATSDPFTQMITWDPATFSSYEATNLGNVRFCSDIACVSPLYAWLESCSNTCSSAGSSSTSATAWVQLEAVIPAGASQTIYMVFKSASTTFDGVYWGEAPQLSSTYAQYDNGANVFTFYDDFAGSTLSGLWNNNVANSKGTLTVNNGLSYAKGSSGNNYPFMYSTTTFSQGVYETYGDIPAGGSSGTYTYMGLGLFSSTNLNAGAGIGDFNSNYGLYTGTGSADTMVSGLTGGTYIWSLFVPSSSPTSFSASQNYGTAVSSTTNLPTLPYSIAFFDQENTGKNIGSFDWVRDRSYPPSGVMPTASVGAYTSSSLAYVPITITNSQSSPTPNTFQQMVTWDPATYSSYEATNLGNIRFCADSACNSPLYAWLESCSSTCSTAGSTSTSATAWVQLTSAIGASGGQLTIYMVFGPTSTNFDDMHWGEAPQLSPIYGMYDIGASVFTAYFNGNTPTSSFSAYTGYTLAQAAGTGGPGGTTINALELSGYTTNNPYPAFVYNEAMSNTGLIVESSFSSPGCTNANPYSGTDTGAVGLLNNPTITSVNDAIGANCGYNDGYFDEIYDNGGTITTDQNPAGTATSSWLYATLTYAGPGASSYSAYISPQFYSTTGGHSGTINSNPISGQTNVYLGQMSYTSSSNAATIYYNFMRARAYPPSGVMPAVSLGGVTTGTGTPTISDSLGDSFTLATSSSVQYSAASSLAVDGTGFHVCNTAGTSCTVTLTTSHTNDVIVLFSSTNGGSTAYPTVSSITGGGLSWQERGRAQCEAGCGNQGTGTYTDTDEWYAISPATLSSVTFTVTLASSSSYTDLSAFGITGANTASPFDTNSGLPVAVTGGSSSFPKVSTSNPNDIIIGGADLYVTTASVGSGFTTLGYTSGDYFADEYAVESTTQSSLTVGYSVTIANADNAIADAIQAATTPTVESSGIWYATASSSGSDTITATFGAAVAGTESDYEVTGYSTAGVISSYGSSSAGSTTASVTSLTPNANSFVVGNVEAGSSTATYTAGSGYTLSGSCASVQGCGEYETGLGTGTTAPFSLGASSPWVDVAASFTPLAANNYYTYVYYATAGSSGSDTISASFGATVAGSVSIYELSGVTATGLMTSTGSSSSSQGTTAVTSITPNLGSIVIGNTETTSTTYTAGSGYTLTNSQACASVTGCAEYQTGVGTATTVPMSISPSAPWVEAAVAFAPTTTTYYSYIWYATAASSGADTITAAFGSTVAGSVSIYEITGYSATGVLSSTGTSPTGSSSAAVASFTPSSDSFLVGNAETASSVTYTASSGFTLGGSCNTVAGCSEYYAGGGGTANTIPITLSSSTGWVESALAFSTPFDPQSGIQVGGYPTMGVPSGAVLAWEVTFTDVDPLHRAVTVWPQTELAIGSKESNTYDLGYIQAHYYIIDGLNPGSTTVNAYTSTTGQFLTLAYNVPTTLYFAATAAEGSSTQTFGNNYGTPFEAYFALTGTLSDGTLFGETIPYPYGIITESNAHTTPTVGSTGTAVTVSCTNPCDFDDNAPGIVGWINSQGQLTQVATFTTTSGGNIPSGVTFQVPSATAGYYTIEVTDYVNSVFMTFQHT